MIKKRLARARALILHYKLDGLLVSMPANRRYLSAFTPDDGQLGESSGTLLISQTAAFLLTDFRYELTAQKQAPLFTTCIHKGDWAAEIRRLVEKAHIKSLGFEAEALLVGRLQKMEAELDEVELVPTSGLVAKLREQKDADEIAAIEKSLDLIEKALTQVVEQGIVGKSERNVALMIVRAVEDLGAEGVAFPPIVAAGKNGAEPHAEPGSHVIKAGEPVIFDVGAKVEGYASDITRTLVAGGIDHADETFNKVYPVVRRAQMEASENIKPGMTGQEADALAREVIDQAGFGERFGHSLGHGVGLMTHEDPSVGPRSGDVLEPGMIFTIEPGIYLPGWGGVRLEHMVHLTQEGCRILGSPVYYYDI